MKKTTCPADGGPTCCCKHLGAFCYFLEEFCRTHNIREQTTSKSSIQQWHQPRKRTTKEPCSIDNIKFIKAEYGKIKKVISTNYDPRPNLLRKTTEDEVQKFRSELELLQTPIAFLDVLPHYLQHQDHHKLESRQQFKKKNNQYLCLSFQQMERIFFRGSLFQKQTLNK